MREIAAEAQVILTRIRCGETLFEAARGFPARRLPPHLARAWSDIHAEIEAGHAGFLDGIESFVTLLKLEAGLRRKVAGRSRLPRLQAYVLAGLAGVLGVVSCFLYPPALRPQAPEILVALGLGVLGWLGLRALERRFERQLWLADWTVFLRLLERQLLRGRTFAAALEAWFPTGSAATLTRRFPPELKARLESLRNGLQRGESAPASSARPTLVQVGELDLVARMLERGQPVAETLAHLASAAETEFDERLEAAADRLALETLVPLFAGFAPALFGLMFTPLLRSLAQG